MKIIIPDQQELKGRLLPGLSVVATIGRLRLDHGNAGVVTHTNDDGEVSRRHWIALFGGLIESAFMAIFGYSDHQLVSQRYSRCAICHLR